MKLCVKMLMILGTVTLIALSIIKCEVKIIYGEGIFLCVISTERNLGPIKMQKRTNFIINYGQIIYYFLGGSM